MLTINKGESNELIVTATEKTTIDNPFYLFVFKNRTTSKVNTFILADTSQFPNRYNSFTFTEGSNAAKTLDLGMANYSIFAQTSSSNIDPDLSDEEVEVGIANVISETESFAEFENNQVIKQYVN